jgi:hypothetical protein
VLGNKSFFRVKSLSLSIDFGLKTNRGKGAKWMVVAGGPGSSFGELLASTFKTNVPVWVFENTMNCPIWK